MPPTVVFSVTRFCGLGSCPRSESDCACLEPTVDVGVDELSPVELDAFRTTGTAEQLGEILDWLGAEYSVGELLAGQPDRGPELRS
jgi:hypothetical protein